MPVQEEDLRCPGSGTLIDQSSRGTIYLKGGKWVDYATCPICGQMTDYESDIGSSARKYITHTIPSAQAKEEYTRHAEMKQGLKDLLNITEAEHGQQITYIKAMHHDVRHHGNRVYDLVDKGLLWNMVFSAFAFLSALTHLALVVGGVV